MMANGSKNRNTVSQNTILPVPAVTDNIARCVPAQLRIKDAEGAIKLNILRQLVRHGC